MHLAMGFPESIVLCMRVKKDRYFSDMLDDPLVGEDVAEDVEGEVAKLVDGIEAREDEAINNSRCAPLPECVRPRNSEERRGFVPEAEVKLDGERHLRIVVVAAPLPVTKAKHSRDVIATARVE